MSALFQVSDRPDTHADMLGKFPLGQADSRAPRAAAPPPVRRRRQSGSSPAPAECPLRPEMIHGIVQLCLGG